MAMRSGVAVNLVAPAEAFKFPADRLARNLRAARPKRNSVSDRAMGTVFRTILGFTVAFAIIAPHSFATYFETQRLAVVKAELAAAHPGAKLQRMIESEWNTLPARNGD
jgi:hypothetical protein